VKPLVQSPELSDGVPPVLLGDFDTVMNVEFEMGQAAQVRFEAGLVDSAPTPELARTMAARLQAAESAIHAADTGDVGGQPMTITTPLARFLQRATLVGTSLRAPSYAVSAAGVVVGLLVLGAATVLWTRRRAHELSVLAVRGSAPLSLGVKGLLEALPALIVGAVAGAAAARALVTAVGPAGRLSGDAWLLGEKLSGVVLAAGAVVVTVVATRRCRKLTDTTPHLHARSRLAAVPWEILIFAAAWVAWKQMSGEFAHTDGPLAVGGTVVSLPPRTLVIPIMLIVGTSILAARLAAAWLRRRSGARQSRSHARFLARRRLGREPAVAALLLAIAAIPAAVAGFAALAAGSVQTTIEDKALAVNGTDIVVTTKNVTDVPAAVAAIGPSAHVLRVDGTDVDGVQTSLLVVDPATFREVATVGAVLAGSAWDRTLDALTTASGAVPTVLASGPIPAGPANVNTGTGNTVLKVNVVHVDSLPGEYNSTPVMIGAPRSFPAPMLAAARNQFWVHTDRTAAVQAAVQADTSLSISRITIAKDLYADSLFEPITYTFQYFVAIALLTGLVVAVGLLLYLESRTVPHRRAYIMLRRMGLRPRTHRAALLWELSIALGLGVAVAAATVTVIGVALRASFDINPAKAPGTILAISAPAVLAIVACVAVTAVAAALFGHARVARARPAEVLRDAA